MDVLEPGNAPLATDLHQLTLAAACFPERKAEKVTCELAFTALPPGLPVLVAAGLDQVVDYLLELRFDAGALRFLRNLFAFKDVETEFWDFLAELRFTGDLWAVPEGTPVFAGEPLLRLRASLVEALLVESFLVSVISYQTLVASRAARLVHAAQGASIVETGLARGLAPGAAVLAARATHVAGAAGTTNAEAGARLGIPVYTTMPASPMGCLGSTTEALRSYVRSFPDATVAVLDTQEPLTAVRNLIEQDIPLQIVSLDSKELGELAREVRRILDDSGFGKTRIMAGTPLDEAAISQLMAASAPIDLFASGAVTGELFSPPVVYAPVAQERDGAEVPIHPGTDAVWPGIKQAFRSFDSSGHILGDVLALEGESVEGAVMLQPALAEGELRFQKPGLESVRRYAQRALESLPSGLLMAKEPGLTPQPSAALRDLRTELARVGSTP